MSPNNFKLIFKFLINVVLDLRQYGFVHSDIKPENIQICFDSKDKNKIILKMIDMGL